MGRSPQSVRCYLSSEKGLNGRHEQNGGPTRIPTSLSSDGHSMRSMFDVPQDTLGPRGRCVRSAEVGATG